MKIKPNLSSGTKNEVIVLFVKNGLGNILFQIEAAARYAKKYSKSLYVDLNESGHYGNKPKNFGAYFAVNNVPIVSEIKPTEFETPYPKDPRLFSRTFIDKELIETRPSSSKWSQFEISQKYDRWKFHWRFKKGGYALRNAENLGLIGKQHDAVIFLTTYIRQEPERFYHLKLADKVLQRALKYFSAHNLNKQPDFGIHIRYTDNLHHAGGKIKDGLNRALKSVELYLSDNPEKVNPVVHLATDNLEVINLFKAQFDMRINLQFLPIERSTQAIHINSDNNEGQFDPYLSALYDIILLSNSRTLAYMGNSSFSRVARCLHPLHFDAIDWNC